MKMPILASTILICALGLPVASAQESSMSGKPVMAMGSDHQMAAMQANIREMQAHQEAMESRPEK